MTKHSSRNLLLFTATLIILLITIAVYVLYTSSLVGATSQRIQYDYYNQHLEGKKIDEVIEILGYPTKGIEHGHQSKRFLNIYIDGLGEGRSVLRYYTGVPIFDKIGIFPFGGSQIYFNEEDKAYIFKGFMD